MKMKIFTSFLILFIFFVNVSGQAGTAKTDPAGKWKFEAPYAPEGYTSGIIEVGFADKKYTSNIMFTGSEYKLTAEKTKFENDSLAFVIYIEYENITIGLKMEDMNKMTGKAVYSEGEIPLTLTRVVEKE